MKEPAWTPRTSSHRPRVPGSGSWPIASRTTLCASGVRVTTGVVAWRSSVVVAMASSLRGRAAGTGPSIDGASAVPSAIGRRSRRRRDGAVRGGLPRGRGRRRARAHHGVGRDASSRAARAVTSCPWRAYPSTRTSGSASRTSDEERTWVFDVTFLTSNWTCIFGNGCQGVLTGPAPELVQGCCSYGAHLDRQEGRPAGREGGGHAHPRGVAEPPARKKGVVHDQQARRDGHATGRRRVHLPQRPRLPRRGRAAPSTSRPSGAASTR